MSDETRVEEFVSNNDWLIGEIDFDAPKETAVAAPITVTEIAPKETAVAAPESSAPGIFPPLPKITGTIHELAMALRPSLPYEYKVGAALTIVGAALSGKVAIAGSEHLQPRFYLCNLGEGGAGKSGSIKVVKEALARISENEHFQDSVESAAGLVASLVNTPRMVLDCDELKDLLDKARNGREGKNPLQVQLLKLYEGNIASNTAKGNIKLFGKQEQVVKDVHFSALVSATTDAFPGLWVGIGGKGDGQQSRWTLIGSNNRHVDEPQIKTDEARLAAIVETMYRQIESAPALIEYPEALIPQQREWWEGAKTRLALGGNARTPAAVTRFLVPLAVTNGQRVVTEEILKQAETLAEYQIEMHQLMMPEDAATFAEANEKRIVRTYEKHGQSGLTRNEARRYVSPNKQPGGYGPFLLGFQNLVNVGRLVPGDKSQRAAIYFLQPE